MELWQLCEHDDFGLGGYGGSSSGIGLGLGLGLGSSGSRVTC